MQNLVDLTGQVVVVTGGGRGLGASHARMLSGLGATVVVTDVAAEAAELVAADVGGGSVARALDVRDQAAWEALADDLARDFVRVHGLVNNAGISLPAGVLETTEEALDLQFRVNVYGSLFGIQALAPLMRDEGGAVVNFASTAALGGYGPATAYSASKWAVRGLTRSAAIDLAPDRIRVNCVCPGAADTTMASEATRAGGGAVASIPISRVARPEEISSMVAFLLSDASSYCTGQEFVVDGGMNA